eukprot:1266111-Amphidinium_carterae.1
MRALRVRSMYGTQDELKVWQTGYMTHLETYGFKQGKFRGTLLYKESDESRGVLGAVEKGLPQQSIPLH